MWSEDDRSDQQRVPQASLKENYRQGEDVLTAEDRNASYRADSKDKYRNTAANFLLFKSSNERKKKRVSKMMKGILDVTWLCR